MGPENAAGSIGGGGGAGGSSCVVAHPAVANAKTSERTKVAPLQQVRTAFLGLIS
jgi:hypothetical protein